jgi:GAF domain-containing protein
MAVPLTLADRVVGLFVLAHGQPGYYKPHHAELVMAIATQAAAAIENARLYDQTDQRANELATLLDVSHSLSSTLELKPLVELILDQLKAVADYTSSSILMLDGDDVVQLSFRWPGISADEAPEQRIPLDVWAPIWEVIRRREPVIIADVRGDSPSAHVYQQAVVSVQTSLVCGSDCFITKDRAIGNHPLRTRDFHTPDMRWTAMSVWRSRTRLAESSGDTRELATLLEVSHAVARRWSRRRCT